MPKKGEVRPHFLGSADLAGFRKICEYPPADSKDGAGHLLWPPVLRVCDKTPRERETDAAGPRRNEQ